MKPFQWVILLLAAAIPAQLFGQAVANADISGVVTDSQGAAIPGAKVLATHTDTSLARTATTNSDGSYLLTGLPLGSYTLQATAQGFSTKLQRGIVLQIGNKVTINIALEVGALTQQVDVSAGAALVETQQTSVSQVIDERRIVDLPLNGRQATQLILLSGAATTTPPGDLISTKNYPSSTTMSIAGGQGNGTNYLMDGGDNNDPWSSVNLPFPFPDALQEFSVENSSLPARFGVHAGGVVNVATRSGSNKFHGDLFEFVRNGDFNARNFFALAQDTLRRNQFGGTIGGPIAKDKLFFFFGTQHTITRTSPPQTISYIPTQAVRNGDFSTIESAACQSSGKGKTLTDPSTGAIFPNNQVPLSRLNPQSVALLKYFPVAADPCGKVVYGVPNPQNEQQYIGRVDWNQSARNNLFGRYFVTRYQAPAPTLTGNYLPSTQPGLKDRSESAVVGDAFSLSPTAINSLHATWSRTQIVRSQAANMIDAAALGVGVYIPSPAFLKLTVANYFSVGCGSCAPAAFNRASVQLADDFDLIRGHHHFAFGGDWIHQLMNSYNVYLGDGSFDFNGSLSGDALGDYMLGLPDNYTQGNISRGNSRQDYIGFYAQDSYRLGTRININAGMRWEPFLPTADIYNRGGSFNMAAFLAGQKSSVYQNSPNGLFFVGDSGIPRGYTNRRYDQFEPRVGFVWDTKGDGRQTVRAGYGFFYDTAGLFFASAFNSQSPWGSSVSLTSPAGGFSNPFAGVSGGNPFPIPVPPTSATVFPTSGTYITLPLNLKPTNTQQWDFSFTRQLGGSWVASVTYLGNVTHHIWGGISVNPAVYAAGATTKNTDQRRLTYLANPTTGKYYSSITSAYDGLNANYNGAIFSLKHRFTRNYTAIANYTYSHCISEADFAGDIGATAPTIENPSNARADRGSCAFDLRQNLNLSLIGQVPNLSNPWERRLLSGWQLSPIITAHSGYWFSPLTGVDNSLTGVGLDRPNLIADAYVRNLDTLKWLNPTSFSANTAGTFGNAGRNSLQGPKFFDVDASVSRDFKVRETETLQLRFEFFNVLNHANFANPTNSLSSKTFGQILSAGDPRIIQLAAKFVF